MTWREATSLPKADATGRIHLVANLSIESLKPGAYEVYAKLFQGARSAQELLFVNIAE